MVNLTDDQIDAALERGQTHRRREPRATKAWYAADSKRVIVELENDCTFGFPARLAQGLETATDEQLAEVAILGNGYGLHWQALDVDLSVPGLLAGVFGTRSYIARRAGLVVTPAKSAAARANGAKGGRPKKAAG
jgi:hypothetical protein